MRYVEYLSRGIEIVDLTAVLETDTDDLGTFTERASVARYSSIRLSS